MHPVQPNRRSSLASLLFLLQFILFLPVTGKAEIRADSPDQLTIPGGLSAVESVLELDRDSHDSNPAIERIFRSLLDADPSPGTMSGINAKRQDLLTYLKDYDDFLAFLGRNQRMQEKPDFSEKQELAFPLTGSRTQIEGTRRMLSFFGIKCRLQPGTSADTAMIEDRNFQPLSHSILYRALGLPDSDPGLREIRIRVKPDKISLLLGLKEWNRILPKSKGASLLKRYVENSKAMRLYLALSSCSPSVQTALLELSEPSLLLKSAVAIGLFGQDLTIKNGSLEYPGTREAWSGIPGSPALSLNALLSDYGAPMLMYSVVRAIPLPVQSFLSSTPKTLQSYYEIVKAYTNGGLSESIAAGLSRDLVRIFRMTTVTTEGLCFALKPFILKPLLHSAAPEQKISQSNANVELTPKILKKLLLRPGISPYAEKSYADALEFFLYLQESRPGLLSEKSIEALVKNRTESPAFLDLIGSLSPDPELLSKYLGYCGKLSAAGNGGWNINRTRTSQSIFLLISILNREEAISTEKASDLLKYALEAFDTEDESSFALNTATFLSTRLLPSLSSKFANSKDPILSALSGSPEPNRILYQGQRFAVIRGAERFSRMQRTIETQAHTPLSILLRLYARLESIRNGQNDGMPEGRFRILAEELNGITTAEWTPGDTLLTQSPDQSRINSLKKELEESSTRTAAPSKIAGQIAAQIHAELGISLLDYCYAYGGAPDINVLAFDPNLIRKHRFYTQSNLQKTVWNRSRFVQDEKAGGWIEGSLAGLEFELMRLRTAQQPEGFGASLDDDTAPAILYGIGHVPRKLRTDRSQEYVALATGLGQSLLAFSLEDERLRGWVSAQWQPVISQKRLDALLESPQKDSPGNRLVSRSELFYLGHAFVSSPDWKDKCPNRALCSEADKLNAIVPITGSADYNIFEEEVDTYGILLSSRIGLSAFSFSRMDSYERLQQSLYAAGLNDRICDFKIRIAELNYRLGLPAILDEAEAVTALPLIMGTPRSGARDWRRIVERINGLNEHMAQGWIENLISRGLWPAKMETAKGQDP